MNKLNLIPIVFLFSLFINNIHGQVHFEETQNNAVFSWGAAGEWDDGAVWMPSVIKDGDTLRMWYTGFDTKVWDPYKSKIGYAWSLDGLIWIRYEGNPVLEAEFEWELPNLSFCAVTHETDTFKMWYGADGGFGYATSTDGKNWTKHPDPVLEIGPEGAWDDYSIVPETVIKEADHYKMWYTGYRSGFPSESAMPQTGLATSPDGIQWTKYNNTNTTEVLHIQSDPVLKVGDESDWDSHRTYGANVLSTDAGYELWYQGLTSPIGTETLCQIGYATSDDGINWMKWPENPIFKDNEETVSWGRTYYPGTILYFEDYYHMWFACFHTSIQAQPEIGYATSSFSNIVEINHPYEPIIIYPNPVSDQLFIEANISIAGTIQMSNLAGQVLYSKKLDNEKTHIVSMSYYPAGVYILTISGKTLIKQMIILKK